MSSLIKQELFDFRVVKAAVGLFCVETVVMAQ
jgi:hypothetical protein